MSWLAWSRPATSRCRCIRRARRLAFPSPTRFRVAALRPDRGAGAFHLTVGSRDPLRFRPVTCALGVAPGWSIPSTSRKIPPMKRRRSATFIALACAGVLVAGCGTVPGPHDAAEVMRPDAQVDGGASPDGSTAPDLSPPHDTATDRSGASDGPGAADRPRTDASSDGACHAEQCNGVDDDCDGVIDNGCPIDQRPL